MRSGGEREIQESLLDDDNEDDSGIQQRSLSARRNQE